MIRLDDVRNTIIQGSALESLKTFPSACVDEIITSPPYWPLRSYLPKNHPDKGKEIGGKPLLMNILSIFGILPMNYIVFLSQQERCSLTSAILTLEVAREAGMLL